jgi:hypothetical protein
MSEILFNSARGWDVRVSPWALVNKDGVCGGSDESTLFNREEVADPELGRRERPRDFAVARGVLISS